MAYLDNNGVLYLWGKIKAFVTGQGYITSADIPAYPDIATNNVMADWESGRVVDAGTLKTVVKSAMQQIEGKADASAIPTNNNQLTNGAGYQTASDVQTAIGSAISGAYKYKGSVATTSALPSSGNTTGDVYNVESTGMNYAWNGSAWDALGESFQITAITNAELDSICT